MAIFDQQLSNETLGYTKPSLLEQIPLSNVELIMGLMPIASINGREVLIRNI